MARANIEFFSTTRDKAEIVDQVSPDKGEVRFHPFETYNLLSTVAPLILGAVVGHLDKRDTVEIKVRSASGTEAPICEVGDGETVVVYSGPRSMKAGFPRLEVTHGEAVGKPKIFNVAQILIDRYYGRDEQ